MKTVKKMPLLFSRDEVRGIGLAIKKYGEHMSDIRSGRIPNPEIEDDEIEEMLASGEAHITDEALLKDVGKRIDGMKDPRSVNLVFFSRAEFDEIHIALACALSWSHDLVMRGRESPTLEEAREHDLFLALAVRFESICSENVK